MDIYSLVAANLHSDRRPAPMSSRAEDRYYAQQVNPPRLGVGLFRSIAMSAGLMLILGIVLV